MHGCFVLSVFAGLSRTHSTFRAVCSLASGPIQRPEAHSPMGQGIHVTLAREPSSTNHLTAACSVYITTVWALGRQQGLSAAVRLRQASRAMQRSVVVMLTVAAGQSSWMVTDTQQLSEQSACCSADAKWLPEADCPDGAVNPCQACSGT
jgi:hypothetical protein